MLGLRIKKVRESKHMTQAQVAEILRISASTVGMYEQGRREPSIDMLVALCRIFDVSLDYLVLGETNNSSDLAGVTH